MSSPFRIVVWGPGGLGSVCIREVLQKHEFELVGVFAYSESKAGRDAGELVGLPPAGVKVTASREEALQIECDCVIYLARDFGNYHYTDEILQILEAGKNVISVLPLQNLEHLGHSCDPQFANKLRAACEKGRSVFHATGIHPNFVAERLAAPLTGLCNDVTQLHVQENWDVSHISAPQLQVVGYGMTPDVAAQQPFAPAIADNYIEINAQSLARALGVRFDRTEVEHEFIPCTADIKTDFLCIEAGTVGRVTHRHKGYVDAFGTEPFQVFEVNWALTPAMYPAGVTPDQYYVVTIEGRPSLKLSLDIQASFAKQQHFVVPGDPASEPGYYATVATCIHAVPMVVKAPPGVLPTPVSAWHWAPDYRQLG
ncbi:MAG TPA: hypothetical protein VFY35_07435 [Burkholderiaceae bacterium]|nr:hypothetical protein [Burkholderiaceae bacterium]